MVDHGLGICDKRVYILGIVILETGSTAETGYGSIVGWFICVHGGWPDWGIRAWDR